MPTGTQPYAPQNGQTLSQYLSSLGQLPSGGTGSEAQNLITEGDEASAGTLVSPGGYGSEINQDVAGYANVGGPDWTNINSLSPSADQQFLSASGGNPGQALAQGPSGQWYLPTSADPDIQNSKGILDDIVDPIATAVPYAIAAGAGAGALGLGGLGGLLGDTGAGITDASLGELGINTALPAAGAVNPADLSSLYSSAPGAATVDSAIHAGTAAGSDLVTGGAAPSINALDLGDAFNAANAGQNVTGLSDTLSAQPPGGITDAQNAALTNLFSGSGAPAGVPAGDLTADQNSALTNLFSGSSGTPGAGANIEAGAGGGMDLNSILSSLKGMGVSPLSLGSLLASVLMKPKPPEIPQLTDLAQGVQSNTANLQGVESTDLAAGETGKLPAGAQTQINQAEQSAEAAIKSKYAAMGLSGSTMEQQDLIGAQNAAIAAQFNEAQTLANQGVQIAGVINSGDAEAAQIYQSIMSTVLQGDQALQSALANFASSSALGAAIANRTNPGGG